MTSQPLTAWRELFWKQNDCLWPGPRPLGSGGARGTEWSPESTTKEPGEARQLRGRDLEVSDLAMACLSNHLLVVHGQSGVGKSSIINVGLIPELESLGKTVVLCKEWGAAWDTTPSEFVSHLAVQEGRLEEDPFGQGVEAVDRRYPNQLVFILDQFEELIRSDPGFAHRVMLWIEEVVGRTSAKFVISLRSEFEHQLRDLRVRPFTKRARIEVAPIDDLDTIRDIIGGDPDDDDDHMPISDEATNRLVEIWAAARNDPDITTWNRPGLLHLQATLYVLWMKRSTRVGGPAGSGLVELGDVEKLCEDLERRWAEQKISGPHAGDRSLFGYGLERSVEASIAACIKACGHAGKDGNRIGRVIRDQTQWIFRDVTEHLASGGYKTPQDLWELAYRVLATIDEPLLRATPTWAPRLFEDPDWLSARPEAYGLAAASEAAHSSLTSGPAALLATDGLLFELYRCYFFALEWMSQTNIVQVLPSGSSYRVTLSHDRFSEGLASWRKSQVPQFDEAIGRYLAHRGKIDLGWTDLGPGLGEDRVVANIRWRQSVISKTVFRDLTFVNCDFAGTTFDGCTFDGAVFVNCVLSDVNFVRCTIRRAPQWQFSNEQWDTLKPETREPLVELPPTFTLPVSKNTARDMTALLGVADSDCSTTLSSPPSGESWAVVLPQVEASLIGHDAQPEEVGPELPKVRGGLVMCGGRLSSLTFRRCTFTEGAKVVLRHIAGTSLEICDQTHGTFDVFASAIRGLTVTRPVTDIQEALDDGVGRAVSGSPAAPGGPHPSFVFDVRYAKVVNTWLGVDLMGEANFEACNVWQLINASDAMSVSIANSGYFGLVNVGSVEAKSLPLGAKHFTESALSQEAVESIRRVSANIDS